MVARPTTALDPGSVYVLYDVGDPSACTVTDAAIEFEIARFTTGSGPDDTAPRPPRIAGVLPCRIDRCQGTSCCGPYETTDWSLDFQPSPDADVIGYATQEGTELPLRFGSWLAFDGPTFPWFATVVGPSNLRARAIDRAGNVSSLTDPVDASSCSPPPSDAGVPGDGGAIGLDGAAPTIRDGGMPVDLGVRTDGATAAPPRPQGTCSAAAGTAEPSWLLMAPLAVWAFARALSRLLRRAR